MTFSPYTRYARVVWHNLLYVGSLVCVMACVSSCRRQTSPSVPWQLKQETVRSLGVEPQFAGVVVVRRLRQAMHHHAHDLHGFMGTLYRESGKLIPYQPDCDSRPLWEKGNTLTVIGFAGMRILYVSLQGTFDAPAYLRCATRIMKKIQIEGHSLYQKGKTFWWATPGRLIGLGINPRPPLFSFGLQHKPTLLGKKGILHRVLNANGPFLQGNVLSPAMLAELPQVGAFVIDGLEDMQLPKGITVRFHRMEGELRMAKELQAKLRISMRQEKHAMRLMGMYHLASALTPSSVRIFLKPLQAKREGRLVHINYQHSLSWLLQKGQRLLPQWLIKIPPPPPTSPSSQRR